MIVKIENEIPFSDIDETISEDNYNDTNNIGLIQRGSEVFFTIKRNPEKKLGVFDIKRKRGVMYNLSNDSSAPFFTSFILLCLYLFPDSSKRFLVHGCGVAENNAGYIFLGPSGAGKSTIARLARSLKVLSDESICIRGKNNSYYIYGAFWGTKKERSSEIKNIFFLKKAKKVSFERIKPALAAERILSSVAFGAGGRQIASNILDTRYLVNRYLE